MRDVLISVALVLAVALPAYAETRALSGFSEISASEGVQIEVSQGDTYAVEVTGRDADKIVTTVHGDRLDITRRGFFHFGAGPEARVRVTMPHLNALRAQSGVQITLNEMSGARLDVNLSQGAVLEAGHVRIGALSVEASQGAMATLDGSCTSLNVRAAMGGMIDAASLQCESASASASMGGSVEIHAKQSVEANASMGGMIEVAGRPTERRLSTGMGGEVDFN
jgi:hypothetical protein